MWAVMLKGLGWIKHVLSWKPPWSQSLLAVLYLGSPENTEGNGKE